MSSSVNVTSYDITLAKQRNQTRYAIIEIVNREFRKVCSIRGQWLSGNVTIDRSSAVRRTGTVTMRIADIDLYKISNLISTNYIRLYQGIENNNTMEVSWYKQGTFIIGQNGFNFDKSTRTLSLTLSDLMCDLNGERAGVLHAYSSITKNSQRIDEVMKNILELCGVTNYDITPICVARKNVNFWDEKSKEEDYYVPYDLEFSAGVTAYEILEKLVTLYSGWEIFFDVDGKFICQRQTFEEDNSFVVIDDDGLRELVISEDLSINWNEVKNYIEVWGKDGHYYGEAKDENPESPFNVAATQAVRYVECFDQIYDRYKDVKLQDTLLLDKEKYEKEIADLTDIIQKCNKTAKGFEKIIENPKSTASDKAAATAGLIAVNASIDDYKSKKKLASQNLKQTNSKISANIDIKGDDMAKQWAEQLLYEKCRTQDTLVIETVGLPFLNDVGFKISYRNKNDDIVKTYVVTNISHNFEGNTTSITAMRFYNDQTSAYQSQLATPKIISASADGMAITVSVSEITHAEQYNLYVDYKLSSSSTGTTIDFTLPERFSGEHYIFVTASANGFRESERSEIITTDFSLGIFLITSNGDFIITSGGDNIEIIEGE